MAFWRLLEAPGGFWLPEHPDPAIWTPRSSNLDSQSVQIQQSALPPLDSLWAASRQPLACSTLAVGSLWAASRQPLDRLWAASRQRAIWTPRASRSSNLDSQSSRSSNLGSQSVQIQQSGLPAIWTPRASRSSNLHSQSVELRGLNEELQQLGGARAQLGIGSTWSCEGSIARARARA